MNKIILVMVLALFVMGCQGEQPVEHTQVDTSGDDTMGKEEIATLAGGCFWCVESSMEAIDGVTSVISGYAGGTEVNPEYKQVASGQTSHREAVQVKYDSSVVSYEEVLRRFFMIIDPTDDEGSFVDRGFQYTSAVFYHNDEQKKIAEALIVELGESGKYKDPIVTPVVKFSTFYVAEDYHQDFYLKSPVRYKSYSYGSGRYQYAERVWGDEYKK